MWCEAVINLKTLAFLHNEAYTRARTQKGCYPTPYGILHAIHTTTKYTLQSQGVPAAFPSSSTIQIISGTVSEHVCYLAQG